MSKENQANNIEHARVEHADPRLTRGEVRQIVDDAIVAERLQLAGVLDELVQQLRARRPGMAYLDWTPPFVALATLLRARRTVSP